MVPLHRSLPYHPDSAGHHIFNLNLALIIVSTILVSLRLFVRRFLVKALGLDDLIATVAWALSVTLSALEMDTVNYGTGAQITDVPQVTLLQFFSKLTTLELIYFIASGAVRLAILAFLSRLSKHRVYTWFIYGLSTIVIAVSLTGFFFMLTECSQIPDVFNYSAPWRQCVDKSQERAMVLAQSVICVLVDCMLVALPLWAVKSHLKMDVKAIQILVVFSLGIFAVASGAARFIIILTTNFTENTTYKMLFIATWTDVELHVGLWLCCLPALQPLIRHASFLTGPQGQLESTNQSGKRDTIISMDQPNSKSRGQRSENQLKESLTEEGVEMTDLEKGKDRGRTLKQRDIMVDANPSHMANAGKKA
ncbi:hypothetical protein LZ32DRAFT_559369, partial [Colletotrichum eremochloae]